MKKTLAWLSIVLISLFCFWFFYLKDARENKLKKKGNELVYRIENFRTKNKRLPYSLQELGVNEEESGANTIFMTNEIVQITQCHLRCLVTTTNFIIQMQKNGKMVIER